MKILNVKIKNYKSIIDSGEIHLHSKINALAGKNNTGKSAFIEAMYKIINGNMSADEFNPNNPNFTNAVIEISVSPEELNLLHENVDKQYQVEDLERFKLTFFYDQLFNNTYLIEIEMYHNDRYLPYYTMKKPTSYSVNTHTKGGTTFTGGVPKFIINIYSLLKSKIVYISGSRHVPEAEHCSLQHNLYTNGRNLNAFLYSLHNNQEKTFDNIVKTFTQIFSDVTSISTPIDEKGNTYITIYFEGIETPIPLSNCGSGYTHVLLLLCVLFTKNDSVVLFDEPQVFLHPSAEKAIYDLVNESGEHQYLFTTHSPILINYPVEKHLFHVSKENGKSMFMQLEHMQKILFDIGVSNSDFALSDKVIFVEGETEELVIPIILSHFGFKQIGYNYRILNMKGTGKEFSKKTAMNNHKGKLDLILGGVSQSPIPYKIIIDADDKSEEKIEEIRSQYSDNIIILDRREYENYFLDCYQELAEIINLELEETISVDEIQTEIENINSDTNDKKLYPRSSTNVLRDVVGSEVLERLFKKYSLTYNKVNHGLHLTNLVLQNTPEKLEFFREELQDFLTG